MINRGQVEFVRWTKANHPDVYNAAVARVGRKQSLGGLGDDLTSDLVFDPSSLGISDAVSSSLANSAADTSGNSWSDIINSVAGAISQVAPQIVQTKAQLATIQINAQRAANNQAPIGAASLLSGQGLGGSTGMLVLVAAILGGGFLLASGGRSKK